MYDFYVTLFCFFVYLLEYITDFGNNEVWTLPGLGKLGVNSTLFLFIAAIHYFLYEKRHFEHCGRNNVFACH